MVSAGATGGYRGKAFGKLLGSGAVLNSAVKKCRYLGVKSGEKEERMRRRWHRRKTARS